MATISFPIAFATTAYAVTVMDISSSPDQHPDYMGYTFRSDISETSAFKINNYDSPNIQYIAVGR